jgi:hypothetical protein
MCLCAYACPDASAPFTHMLAQLRCRHNHSHVPHVYVLPYSTVAAFYAGCLMGEIHAPRSLLNAQQRPVSCAIAACKHRNSSAQASPQECWSYTCAQIRREKGSDAEESRTRASTSSCSSAGTIAVLYRPCPCIATLIHVSGTGTAAAGGAAEANVVAEQGGTCKSVHKSDM